MQLTGGASNAYGVRLTSPLCYTNSGKMSSVMCQICSKVYSVLVTVITQGPWMTPSLNVQAYTQEGVYGECREEPALGGAGRAQRL